jgi:hypothetical protein
MPVDPTQIAIYHITDVTNLPGILQAGGLKSDCAMVNQAHTPIGYAHIKQRRMTEIRVPCRGNRFVGEFVPFYYCPRSPMLYVVNKGTTGRAAGCQTGILHLVSTVAIGMGLGPNWAVSDGNAGAAYASFYDNFAAGYAAIDWNAVRATDWRQVTNQKSAEFLVPDFFPWVGVQSIGCHDSRVAEQVRTLLTPHAHQPTVQVQPGWYY